MWKVVGSPGLDFGEVLEKLVGTLVGIYGSLDRCTKCDAIQTRYEDLGHLPNLYSPFVQISR